MTPKEKAEELFIKCYPNWYDNGLVAKKKYAKEYALIAVDEIINNVLIGIDLASNWGNYWQEVKNELEKL
jgi:hypothetical protein